MSLIVERLKRVFGRMAELMVEGKYETEAYRLAVQEEYDRLQEEAKDAPKDIRRRG